MFTTTLDELEDKFESVTSSLETNEPTGFSPEFLKKILYITEKDTDAIVDSNTQLNCQTNDGLVSRHFSTNDHIL